MTNTFSRRRLLQVWGGLVSFVAVGRGVFGSPKAQAQAKAPQAQVKYQETPKGKQECSNCLQFEPPSSCKLVAGKINPKGWCLLYAPKPTK